MYYHVVIETVEKVGKKDSNKEVYELDKTDTAEIQERVIIPYLRKEEIHLNGYFIKPENIKRILIRSTTNSSKQLADHENDTMPPGIIMIIRAKDVVHYEKHSNDVTKELFDIARQALKTQAESTTNLSRSAVVTKPTRIPPVAGVERARLFIGSSREGLPIAEAIQGNLDHELECTIWHQGVFGLSAASIESLEKQLTKSDFAVLVITPDDITESRGSMAASPRDNVIFELGLFMGSLGRSRTFVVRPRKADVKMPSDLLGITSATYDDVRSDDNLNAALGKACSDIKRAVKEAGPSRGV